MRETGYGSADFLRACDAWRAVRQIPGSGTRVTWRRMHAGGLTLARYHRSLPALEVNLSSSPAGRMIAEHLSIREGDRWRYRDAQAVLRLPDDFGDYLRGRHRQAVRTNTGHARRAGMTIASATVDDWGPGPTDTRLGQISAGPVERWMALAPDGAIVGDSIVSVDEDVALLHGLVSYAPNARWLLHTAIVERLCGECSALLVNCDDAYLLGEGTLYFQRLLGYEITRLRVARARRPGAVLFPAPTIARPRRTPELL